MILGGKVVYKVAFNLADGRTVIPSQDGKHLLWEQEDVDSLTSNILHYGLPWFTKDLKHYDVDFDSLHTRFPCEELVAVVGWNVQNPSGRPILLHNDPELMRFYDKWAIEEEI
jgi:hypothetical protein